MKVTIGDVARESGVSISTVSRVINGCYPVKGETRLRVTETIERLGFTPNALARGLILKKTLAVGIVMPNISNLFFTEVVKGIQGILQQRGYTLMICDTESIPETEKLNIHNLIDRRVDGIIAIDPSTSNIKQGLYEQGSTQLPLVIVNGYNRGINCNYVLNDEEAGSKAALEYLISLGHTDIAFIRGESSYSYDIKENVYKRVMRKHKLAVRPESTLTISSGNTLGTVDESEAVFTKLLFSGSGVTAVFACNDWIALGAIHAANRCGRSVPRDISVIGYDNIIISQLGTPKLTTVDQQMNRLGATAARMLVELIDDPSNPAGVSEAQDKRPPCRKVVLDTKLIMRESCANIPKKL